MKIANRRSRLSPRRLSTPARACRAGLEPLESRVLMSTYYLSPGGSDSAAGSQAAPWRTLDKAASSVSSGDEVVLRAGTYAGGVTFDDPNLLIRSYAGERAVISAPTTSSSVEQALRLGVNASGSTVRGLEITGGYYYALKLESYWDAAAPGAEPAARNVTIEDNVLHGSGRDVIKITPDCNDVVIRRNEIYDSGLRDGSNAEGIDNVNGDRTLVQDNYIHDTATTGVYLKGGASGGVIERNRIENTGRSAVELGFYTDAEFFDPDNTSYYENIDSVVRNNIFSATSYAGVGMYGALRPQVYNNTLVNVATSGHAGFLFAPAEVAAPSGNFVTPSRDARIFNNIVVTAGRPMVQIRASGLAGTLTADNNRYRSTAGAASFADERGGFSGGLAAWRTRVGGEAASTEGDPLLDATGRLTASSPAINAGRDLSSAGFANDFDNQARPAGAAWDVGADEYNGAVTPPPADTTAPVISSVAASSPSASGTTITWTTNEASDSQVQYGTTTAYGSATAVDSTRVTGHSVTVSGLQPSTLYHYRVLSRDAAGNLATSADFTFTTAAAPPPSAGTVFSPVEYSGDFANYAPLTASRWTVTTDAAGEKRLGINTSAYDAPAEDKLGEFALLNGRTYGDFDVTLKARSDESLAANPSADYAIVFAYQDANNYSYLMMSGKAGNTRLFRVSGGVPTALPAAATAGIPDANWHNVTLSRRGTTVTVALDGRQVLSTTDAGLGAAGGVGLGSYNDAASFDDPSFTSPTAPPPPADTTAPAISGVSASNIGQSAATINWTTNEPATTQVQYGTTTAYGSTTALDSTLATSHAASLTGLAAGTTYHYRVLSRDAAGNLATSGDFTFDTAAAPSPTAFSPAPYTGEWANYAPRTASRWSVTTEASGEKRLTINTTDIAPPAEDLLGEYAILKGRNYGDFDLTLKAKTLESLSGNPSADYVVVFGYKDANNYSYLMMSAKASNTRFFTVVNGVPTALPAAKAAGIPDANWHDVKLTRRGSTVTASLDGVQILSTTDARLGAAGGVGVGSYNDAASFDDITATGVLTA